MQKLSQRDPSWGDKYLGTSRTKIKSYGCTITCLTMLANLFDVGDVNERLKAVNGFASGNLLIWSKINAAIPWLTFEWRGYSYDNDKVKKAIADNGGCLVEVNGAPIGGTKHWVLYTGNGKLIDPWDGKEKPTASYSPTGYSIIRNDGNSDPGGSEGDKMYTEEEMTKVREERDKNWNLYQDELKKNAKLIDEKSDLEKKVSDYEKTIEDQDKTLFSQKEDIRNLETELAACEAQSGSETILEEIDGYEINGIKKTYFQEDKEIEVNYTVKETI